MHDQIYVNDIGFYFLADRLSATRYHELHTGVATTLPVQIEITKELEDHKVNWVVLRNIEHYYEPNASSLSSGVVHLDNYLNLNYRPVAKFGNYSILKRSTGLR